jgi:AcrR family transcriptional regulator
MSAQLQLYYGKFMEVAQIPAGRREKRKQEIRGRIEHAAYTLFERQGIDETSIEQICVDADVARRTFYGHFPNKHALIGGMGINGMYSQSAPMLLDLMTNHQSTRARLQAMIDYIESNFTAYNKLDRELFLMAPLAFAHDKEQQREIGMSAIESFKQLFVAGQEIGDVETTFSPEILAVLVVGTLNTLTTSWAMDDSYPVFARLEEARIMFDILICPS